MESSCDPPSVDQDGYEWATSLEQSFVQSAYAMFDYMTDRNGLGEDEERTVELQVQGDSLATLLHNFLDELLFRFIVEPFLAVKRIQVLHFDPAIPSLTVRWTEIKAVTYSNMQIMSDQPTNDIYVIFDI